MKASHSLQEAVHHQLAEFGGEGEKISGKAGDTHHQIRMGFGIGMGFKEGVFVKNIDVDQRAALLEMPKNEGQYRFHAALERTVHYIAREGDRKA